MTREQFIIEIQKEEEGKEYLKFEREGIIKDEESFIFEIWGEENEKRNKNSG